MFAIFKTKKSLEARFLKKNTNPDQKKYKIAMILNFITIEFETKVCEVSYGKNT